METSTKQKPLKALLVGIQLPKVSDEELQGSLAELARLVTTLGYTVIGQTSQKRKSQRGATVVGEGKLEELAQWTGGTGEIGPMVVKKKHKAALKFDKNQPAPENEKDDEYARFLNGEIPDDEEEDEGESDLKSQAPTEKADVLIFDSDLSPSQMRNLESATGVTVLDRTGVIIEIFSRHARTKAARLQVEIARLTYVAPRLRETGGGEDRGGGGVGGKGSGESTLELDRRKIRDRIKELKEELGSISKEHDTRRSRRDQEITVALVGYTNAGKSSLMRALTGSEVLVADKLFATLDTTVRLLYPESRPRILVSDTVGFIKKLPHDLVASFKSTLDEALNASLLLYVVDSSDPTFRSQLEVTKSVLTEVGAGDVQSLMILNKMDRLTPEQLTELKNEFPDALFLSAKNPQDVSNLRLKIISYFESDMVDEDLFIPYTVQGAVGEVRAKMRVLGETYSDQGVTLKVRGHAESIERVKSKFLKKPSGKTQ
ncbi:MAG: GTPase HflX [Bdellovibrionota bacterium]